MKKERTVKSLLYGELSEGSRSVGRPKLCFKDNLKSILKKGNILQTWNNSVQNRPEWRTMIQSATNAMNCIRKEKYDRAKERRKNFIVI